MKKLSACFITFLVTVACVTVVHAQQRRIVNGHATSVDTPWMVALSDDRKSTTESDFCGGALITEEWVITAAHCVLPYVSQPNHLRISYGSSSLSSLALKSLRSDGILIHEAYNEGTVENDIALVHLEAPVFEGSFLKITREILSEGDTVQIFGWGLTNRPIHEDNSSLIPTVLQTASIPIRSTEECRTGLGDAFVPEVMLCAGTLSTSARKVDGVDSCYGDSGGPLVRWDGETPYLAGIVSWGLDCASNKSFGIYTRVANFVDWISSPKTLPAFLKERPKILGRSMVGSRLSCSIGEVSGDIAEKTEFRWIDTQSGKVVSHKKSLKLNSRLKSRSLHCLVTLRNAGGETENKSPTTYRISASPPQKVYRPTSPYVIKAEVRCSSSTCRVDFETIPGVRQLSAELKPRACGSANCRTNKKVSARKSTENNWVMEWNKAKYFPPQRNSKVQVVIDEPMTMAVQIKL